MIAQTPSPPYYAVIFSSVRTDVDEGYGSMADRMVELAHGQPGFLGVESARESPSDGYRTDAPAGAGPFGITVSYWDSLSAIRSWKEDAEHRIAQQTGRDQWYQQYKVRICKVEREYGFDNL